MVSWLSEINDPDPVILIPETVTKNIRAPNRKCLNRNLRLMSIETKEIQSVNLLIMYMFSTILCDICILNLKARARLENIIRNQYFIKYFD